MTLKEYTLIGTYSGICYKNIVKDLGIEEIFKSLTGTSVKDYNLDVSEEDELLHELLKLAPEEYVLYSDVVNSEMYYAILKVE